MRVACLRPLKAGLAMDYQPDYTVKFFLLPGGYFVSVATAFFVSIITLLS